MRIRRAFLIVLDSFGIGALPDPPVTAMKAAIPLAAVMARRGRLPNLGPLGLFHIEGAVRRAAAEPGRMGASARLF